eukprot:TRINITY_DN561_c0_g2_i1.p1 TRINITY_DN561_c0_g2~~TRINITY_DN561_c0_g2_i1.p1  ORF type:complete len:117 (-),score=16.65 TRINITY_DN561_c0_g2_i1:298-648(-)
MKAVLLVALLALFFTSANAQSGFVCPLCEFAVKYIEEFIAQNQTTAEIVQNLDLICQVAPEILADECVSFVNSEVPAIVNYIITTDSPETACTQLDLCSSFFGVKAIKPHTKHFKH